MSATSTQGPTNQPANIGDTHDISYRQRHGKDSHVEATSYTLPADGGLPAVGRVLTDEGDHFAIRWAKRGVYVYRRVPKDPWNATNPWRDRGVLILILH